MADIPAGRDLCPRDSLARRGVLLMSAGQLLESGLQSLEASQKKFEREAGGITKCNIAC